MPTVLITDLRHKTYEIEKCVLAGAADLIFRDIHTEDEMIKQAAGADAIILDQSPMTAKVIAGLQKCKIISRYGVGYDNVAVDAATTKKIWVANVPDYCTEDASDQAMALLMSCVKHTVYRHRQVCSGKWNIGEDLKVHRIRGKNFGFIGYGKIGKAFHRKLSGFGLKAFLGYDPYLTQESAASFGIRLTDLDTLCKECDFISIHAPLTAETRDLIGSRALGLMKQNAILINTARGPIIDENALTEALKAGIIGAAGLDVFSTEPPDHNSQLFALNNVVLSDHHAWYSEESFIELKTKAAENVLDVLKGGNPRYPVNQI